MVNEALPSRTRAPMPLCQPVGRPPLRGANLEGEESPGSSETRCRITSGGGNPRESATESKPPPGLAPAVRVKGCGKSAPRAWQQERHGKPHREQDRIGATRPGPARDAGKVRLTTVARVGCSRRQATAALEEWPSRAGCHNPAPYRTRLTGRLALAWFGPGFAPPSRGPGPKRFRRAVRRRVRASCRPSRCRSRDSRSARGRRDRRSGSARAAARTPGRSDRP